MAPESKNSFEVDFSPLLRSNSKLLRLSAVKFPRMLIARGNMEPEFKVGVDPSESEGTDCVALLIPEACVCEVSCAGESQNVGSGDVQVLDLLQESFWRITESSEAPKLLLIVLARSRILNVFPNDHVMHGHIVRGAAWTATGIRSTVEWLERYEQLQSPKERTEASEAAVLFIARCLRSSVNELAAASPRGTINTLPKIIRYINLNLGSTSLTPEVLEGTFGVSRASLYRLFRPLGGVSNFIRERRLARARTIFQDRSYGDDSIDRVARSCGFSSISTFRRAYALRFKETPLETKTLRSRAPADPDPDHISRVLQDLL